MWISHNPSTSMQLKGINWQDARMWGLLNTRLTIDTYGRRNVPVLAPLVHWWSCLQLKLFAHTKANVFMDWKQKISGKETFKIFGREFFHMRNWTYFYSLKKMRQFMFEFMKIEKIFPRRAVSHSSTAIQKLCSRESNHHRQAARSHHSLSRDIGNLNFLNLWP